MNDGSGDHSGSGLPGDPFRSNEKLTCRPGASGQFYKCALRRTFLFVSFLQFDIITAAISDGSLVIYERPFIICEFHDAAAAAGRYFADDRIVQGRGASDVQV